MRKNIIISLLLVVFLTTGMTVQSTIVNQLNDINFDPLVDIEVTVEINAIRYLEDQTTQSTTLSRDIPRNRASLFLNYLRWQLIKHRVIDDKPNMYTKVFINGIEFVSLIYPNTYYVYDPDFSATLNVPNNVEFVDITIQLWNSNKNGDIPLDISPIPGTYEAHMVYSIKTGHWTGDDYLGDPSGYGRLNGCEDGSIYEREQDCELWFDIYQNTYDGSGIPYWMQVYEYGLDPMIDNTGIDYSNDGIPIEWEWKYGYDPFISYDHHNLDPSEDAITNYEKYLTWDSGSDPFRKDVFVELAVMQDGPNGEKTYFPEESIELLKTAFNRQNIVLHVDISERVPFYNEPSTSYIRGIYNDYFIKNDAEQWKEGVFHYGLILYNVPEGRAPGFAFRRNAFIVASQGMEQYSQNPFTGSREVVYASAFMHELGHTFGFWPIPGHNRLSMYPWQPLYWTNLPYRSCMNYGWMYQLVDYSDGSAPSPDLNDWERINYHYFIEGWG